jgi:hypothetical protein
MKRDEVTGLDSYTEDEVRALNPPGPERAERVDWNRWRDIAAYVVRAAAYARYGTKWNNPWDPESVEKLRILARAERGELLEIWLDNPALTPLAEAEEGQPFRITRESIQPLRLKLVLGKSHDALDEAAERAALLARAEENFRNRSRQRAPEPNEPNLFPSRR